jgi:hypothetical protein
MPACWRRETFHSDARKVHGRVFVRTLSELGYDVELKPVAA